MMIAGCNVSEPEKPVLLPSLEGATGAVGTTTVNPENITCIYFFSPTSQQSLQDIIIFDKLTEHYLSNGLKTLLVLSPEFDFCRNRLEQETKIKKIGVNLPVLFDFSYKIWSRFGFTSDGCGVITKKSVILKRFKRDTTYVELERSIRKELSGNIPEPLLFESKRNSVRIQLGYLGGQVGNCLGTEIEHNYNYPETQKHELNKPYLLGTWFVGSDFVWHTKKSELAKILLTFEGSSVFAVLRSHGGSPVTVNIWIDGKLIQPENYGSDMVSSTLQVNSDGIYNIASFTKSEKHILAIESNSPDLQVYSLEVLGQD